MNEQNREEKKVELAIAIRPEEELFLEKLVRDVLIPNGFPLSAPDAVAALVRTVQSLFDTPESQADKEGFVRHMVEVLKRGHERRKFLRLKKTFLAGFRKVESIGHFTSGITENISVGGFKIDVPYLITPLSCGQLVEITLKQSEREDEEQLKGMGKIVWLRKKEEGAGFEIGVMITHVREEDKGRLQQYLEEEAPHPKE